MEVKIKDNNSYVDADWTIEDGVMVVSPKVEKFEPKDGDVVTVTNETGGNYTCFFKDCVNGDVYSYGGLNNLYNMLFEIGLVCCSKKLKTIHPATEEEKKLLFNKLKEEGYEWDAEKKKVVKIKWKPVLGEVYFRIEFVDHEFRYADWNWKNSTYEIKAYEGGWCFKTKEKCQEFCNRLNDAINQVKL